MSKKASVDSELLHAACSLFYTWCNLYEKNYPQEVMISKIRQIVTDDIMLTNVDGVLKGIDKFIQRVLILKKWTIALHTRNIRIKEAEGNSVFFVAESTFQAVFPDFSCNEYNIDFHFEMVGQAGQEPKIRTLTVEQRELLPTNNFRESYETSRTLAFVHRWISLANASSGQWELYRDLLTEDFRIVLDGREEIDDWDSFISWIGQTSFLHKAAGRLPKNFQISCTPHNNDLRMCADLESTHKGRRETLSSSHDWLLQNNPQDSYLKVKTMNILTQLPAG